jgi:predicted transposase YdaD
VEADGNLEEAIGTAIDEMPDHFCIKRYLEAHRAEVKTMLLTEYNEARQMDLFYRDGLEKGEIVGRREGRLEGRREGRLEGRREGRLEGRREGRLEGQAMISSLMERLLSAGRIEEAKRAASDSEYREQLLRELRMN